MERQKTRKYYGKRKKGKEKGKMRHGETIKG